MTKSVLFSHQVSSLEEGKMLQQVLKYQFSFSRNMLRRLKRKDLVTVNEKNIYFTARVHEGDHIKVYNEDLSNEEFTPQRIPLTIVYEDQDVMVINKQPGLVVHPTKGYPDGTLVNGLQYYFLNHGQHASIHLVNRLDKDTSGLMLVAKHPYAHAFLTKQLINKNYQRTYIAIVHGEVKEQSGTINAPITRKEESSILRTVCFKKGVQAISHYTVLERFPHATMLKVSLETGRTHQIRVHLAHKGFPLIGDELYGAKDKEQYCMTRQALHAYQLGCIHPRKKEWCQWESFLPQDITKLSTQLRKI